MTILIYHEYCYELDPATKLITNYFDCYQVNLTVGGRASSKVTASDPLELNFCGPQVE